MQRDMKIGMALGVALIGIVGALFFRRDQKDGDEKTPPQVANVEQIDREIAEKDKIPYIQAIEQFDAPAAPVPPPGGSAKPNSGVRFDKRAGKDDTKLRETAAGQSGTPDSLHATRSDAAAISPAHNLDWQPTGPSATTGKKAGAASQSSPESSITDTGRTHVIRPGDTLSGLASRYLGSSARFREIYEANCDQLRCADDVREGMTLKIPDAGKPREGQPVAATADSDPSAARPPAAKTPSRTKTRNALRTKVDNAVDDDGFLTGNERSTDAPRGKSLFEPVPRGPFSAGRVRQPEAN